jgi:hypothetical protein
MQIADSRMCAALVLIVGATSSRVALAEDEAWCNAFWLEVMDVHRIAQKKFDKKEFEDVIRAYSHLLEQCPNIDRIEIRRLRAELYFNLKHCEHAAREFDSIVEAQQGRVCDAATSSIYAWSCVRGRLWSDGFDRSHPSCVRRPLDYASKMTVRAISTFYANCQDTQGAVHMGEAQIYQEFGMLEERDRALTSVITSTQSYLPYVWRARRVIKSSCPE